MDTSPDRTCIAFAGSECVAQGALREVAVAAKTHVDRDERTPLVVFDAATSATIELDLRGSVDDVAARYAPVASVAPPRGPGRPKLGVVAREVTLLPRHWEWLATQPGGASVTLRKLVEHARRLSGPEDRQRLAQEATYRFMLVSAGNEPGYEEATRALYAGDSARFDEHTAVWPVDVRDHARDLAAAAFAETE